MSSTHLELLRHSCGLATDSESCAPTAGVGSSRSAAQLILRGGFVDAVQTDPALKALLDCSTADADAVHDAASYYAIVGRRAAAAVEAAIASAPAAGDGVREGSGGSDAGAAGAQAASEAEQGLEAVLTAGVACLHIFGQHNLTGPSYPGPPPSPLDLFAPPPVAKHLAEAPPRPPAAAAAAAIAAIKGEPASTAATPTTFSETADVAPVAAGPGSGTTSDGLAGLGVDSLSRGDRWAQEQLQLDGEDQVGRCPAVQWLLLARVLLLGPLSPPPAPAPAPAPGNALQEQSHPGDGQPQQQQQQQEHSAGHGAAEAPAAALSRLGPLVRSCRAAASAAAAAPAGLGPAWCWCWWALRCVMSHQHVLEGRVHSLLSEASQLIQVLVAPESPLAHPVAEAAALGGVMHVELALCQYLYGYVDAGRQYLVRAGQLLGLEPQLTGALGKRTVHQVDPKAQLVVVASEGNRSAPPSDQLGEPVEALGLVATSASSAAAGGAAGAGPANRELEGLRDESDVLPAPVLVGEKGELLDTKWVLAPEQALLLAWATAVKKGSSADDLQEWQMAPWVEAVLAQRRGVFMTAAAARLSKIRHERTRGRTKERALLLMDQLSEAVSGTPPEEGEEGEGVEKEGAEAGTSPPPAAEGSQDAAAEQPASEPRPAPGETDAAAAAEAQPQLQQPAAGGGGGGGGAAAAASGTAARVAGRRSALSWAVWFPLQVKLRREAAEHYVAMGLVGAAIRVFESLELWDSALTCYRLLGKKALAEELIRRRLGVTPDDPRLWCALGDLHLDDRYYEEAWRRSGQRHTRSQRSLARSAMRRKDYAKASGHWQAALALNPLHPEAWFSLGFCYLKLDKHREALRAFTRVTQQEPDNGEAWNNIAALWMHLGGYRPAFAALSESVRHKRDSWQTWENYARAALASGHYQQAVRGLQMALRLSSGQRLFIDVASGLLDVLEGRPPPRDGGTSLSAAAAAAAEGLQGVALEALDAEGGGGGGATAAGDASLQEDEAALGVPLLPLLSDLPLRTAPDGPDDADTDTPPASLPGGAPASEGGKAEGGGAASDAAGAGAGALLTGREREVVLGGVGSLLREAVNSSAASPALWGCLARYWALKGEADSAKEARIKQVRGLAGGAYKSDAAKFAEYAEASEALCRAYLTAFQQGRAEGLKDLAGGRMHLRGLLRATAENFGEHPQTARLQALLEEITKLEDEALAASRAASKA